MLGKEACLRSIHTEMPRGAVAAAVAVSFTRLGSDTLGARLPALPALTGIGSGLDITRVRWTHGGCFLGRSGRVPLAWPGLCVQDTSRFPQAAESSQAERTGRSRYRQLWKNVV